MYFYQNFTEVCSQLSNWQKPSIDLDSGLAPNMRQAIIWTNADPIYLRIYAALRVGDALRWQTVYQETSLQCNDVAHWQGAHLDWSPNAPQSVLRIVHKIHIFPVLL